MNDNRFTAVLGTVHGVFIKDLLSCHVNIQGTKSITMAVILTTERDLAIGKACRILWTLADWAAAVDCSTTWDCSFKRQKGQVDRDVNAF